MSGFSIGHLPRPAAAREAGAPAALDAKSSRDLLAGYAAHITTAKGVKAGVLRLVDGAGGDTRIYRDRAYHVRSRDAESVKGAGQTVRQLFAAAYQGKLSNGAYTKLMEGLDGYLEARGGQMGTRSFEKFFRAFETAIGREQTLADAADRLAHGEIRGPVKLTDAAVSKLLGYASEENLSDLSVSTPQSRAAEEAAARRAAAGSMNDDGFAVIKRGGVKGGANDAEARQGAADAFGLSTESVRALGHGNVSQAYFISGVGEADTVAVVPLQRRAPITKDAFGVGELAAALARSPMSHVSKPTEFVLTVSMPMSQQLSQSSSDSKRLDLDGGYVQAFRVPADGVRAFFNQVEAMVPDGSPKPTVSIAAVRMPAGPSTNLRAAVGSEALSANEFSRFAAGLFLGVDQMGKAGLVHHDLKPENVVFDRQTGRTMLIDLGGAVKLGEDGSTRLMNERNPLTMPPSVRREGVDPMTGQETFSAHGHEYDRYGFAVTLMTSLSPSLERSLVPQAFAEAFAAAQPGPEGRVGDLLASIGKLGEEKLSQARPKVETQAKDMAQTQAEEKLSAAGDGSEAGSAQEAPPKVDPASERLLKDGDLLLQVKEELALAFERDPDARAILEQALAAGLSSGDISDQAWQALGASITQRALQTDPMGSDSVALKKLFGPQIQGSAEDAQMPFAGDPTGRQKGVFLNQAQSDDPYGE